MLTQHSHNAPDGTGGFWGLDIEVGPEAEAAAHTESEVEAGLEAVDEEIKKCICKHTHAHSSCFLLSKFL